MIFKFILVKYLTFIIYIFYFCLPAIANEQKLYHGKCILFASEYGMIKDLKNELLPSLRSKGFSDIKLLSEDNFSTIIEDNLIITAEVHARIKILKLGVNIKYILKIAKATDQPDTYPFEEFKYPDPEAKKKNETLMDMLKVGVGYKYVGFSNEIVSVKAIKYFGYKEFENSNAHIEGFKEAIEKLPECMAHNLE
jgi:hypothetical protein